jgi:hypothetical protein
MEPVEPEQSKAAASEAVGNTDSMTEHSAGESKRAGLKTKFLHHAKEIFATIVYLAITFSLLATFRCLVLVQAGVNDFAHSYAVAIGLSVALGKIVALAQNHPFVTALNNKPLAWSVLYKAAVLTVIADLACFLEGQIFHHPGAKPLHPIILSITHQLALMWIFIPMFIWRDFNRVLGRGRLFELLFRERESV